MQEQRSGVSRRNVGRIAGYVTEVATLKTDKKTSNIGGLFVASCLSTQGIIILTKIPKIKQPDLMAQNQ